MSSLSFCIKFSFLFSTSASSSSSSDSTFDLKFSFTLSKFWVQFICSVRFCFSLSKSSRNLFILSNLRSITSHACLADFSANQLSPSKTKISLVLINRPCIKATFEMGIVTWYLSSWGKTQLHLEEFLKN
ncbi:hypothetical protein BpHYR1_049545 [Brachionus plicatilis]|uniref:Secreted protein n=1 Tax=Brachionus plicatilis TaxID=10195 RepID=A0A3M7SB25_BRAPC|nr:hypothetical protein BpHYR1_049545 [Brachionus plicatilis]